ncbi:Maltose/maltodextrin transport system permease protein MalG [Paenibacillus plantiphilus]|uniref:Maltose/maltodextrin transport system permease protein MalG n=1 Tax=Paenibacillus plantiphilus TaxID=2905650 RepID=A0ABM9C0H1_9BACL|nr:sugar ABC transporter permease [Paenibacillus plantiphilus]CAH1197911.1 Maltose/maltodextrin transport system permease protein MalG [Paenibacillus plantiphilus]
MINRMSTKFRVIASYLFLAIVVCWSLYPAAWVVLSSFKPGKSLYSESFIPKSLTLDHYTELFQSGSLMFSTWYMNTFKVAIFSMLLSTFLVTITAYALSRFRFPGRKASLTLVLVLGMFPGFMSMVAVYILLMQLGLLDTHMALVIVYSFGSIIFNLFVAKGFFDTLPKGIEEAARIDGASNFRVFTSIMLPLSKPMLVFVALTTFTGAWVDFIFASLVLRSKEKWTVAVGLYDMVNSYQNAYFTLFAAGAVFIAIPITILFMYLQRYFVDGLTAGANKG